MHAVLLNQGLALPSVTWTGVEVLSQDVASSGFVETKMAESEFLLQSVPPKSRRLLDDKSVISLASVQ